MAEVLTREDLWERLRGESPLVAQMIDAEAQVQPNGIELTLCGVERFIGPGAIGIGEDERRLAPGEWLEFDEAGWLHLAPGAYRVRFNEIVNLPRDVVALARPRSSLGRSGATVETGLWDSGYHGRSESLLLVFNEHGCNFKRNARLVQLLFFQLSKPVGEGYAGRYQGENLAGTEVRSEREPFSRLDSG